MVTSTISYAELIWTVAASIGFIFNLKVLFSATADLFILRYRRINSIREYAAMTTVYMFGAFTFVQFGFVVVGSNAMITINPKQHLSRQVIPGVVFITTSVILAITAVIVDHRRAKLKKKIEEIEN